MFKNIGSTELIIIVLICIIFFGSKRMSELAKQAGKASKQLKKVKKESEEALKEVSRQIRLEESASPSDNKVKKPVGKKAVKVSQNDSKKNSPRKKTGKDHQ